MPIESLSAFFAGGGRPCFVVRWHDGQNRRHIFLDAAPDGAAILPLKPRGLAVWRVTSRDKFSRESTESPANREMVQQVLQQLVQDAMLPAAVAAHRQAEADGARARLLARSSLLTARCERAMADLPDDSELRAALQVLAVAGTPEQRAAILDAIW